MEVIVIPSDHGETAETRPPSGRNLPSRGGEAEDGPEAILTNALRNILTIASYPEFVGDADGALESIKGILHRALESATDEPV